MFLSFENNLIRDRLYFSHDIYEVDKKATKIYSRSIVHADN